MVIYGVSLTVVWFNYRWLSGIDKKFYIQLFVQPDENPAVNTQGLLSKMFQEQTVTFAEVC